MSKEYSVKQAEQLGSMTQEEAVARARALAPAIRERAASAETQRRQPAETIREIVEAGLVRLLIPKRWGGCELPVDALAETALAIAKADGSTGWCYAFLVGHPWLLAHFPDEAQRDVWGENPDALLATSFVPEGRFTSVEGGYRLSGNWPWSSGVDHCEWNLVLALPASMDGPPRLFLLPKSDYEIMDTWFVTGLAASGSNNVVAKDIFVPEHRTLLLPHLVRGQSPSNPGPLYTLPFLSVFIVFLSVPLLGTTLAAYESWRDASRSKYTMLSHEAVASFTHQQIRFAEITADIAAAQALLKEALSLLHTDGQLSLENYNRINLYHAAIGRFCLRAVEQLYT
ncbi:MAG: acyl-CoA dehydrogenase family protein, partial [Ktedonobacteraceae bacterium]